MRIDRAALLAQLDADELDVLTRLDFALFAQIMFAAYQPGTPLVWGPYLDLICARLGDVAHGRCRNLIITLPPRHLKSFCVSVALPAFVLGHYPDQSILCVSYGMDLAKDLAAQFLRLVQTPAYRELFGTVIKGERPALHLVPTRAGGVRRATSLDGAATGLGGDLIIFDDPQKPGEVMSEAIRRSTNEAYAATFFSRANNPATARRVIVMQRLHDDDFVAAALGRGGERWEVINLPAIAEEDQLIDYVTPLGMETYFRRTGEALHEARTPLWRLREIRDTVGEALWATQYQQRPAPAGGGQIRTEWFRRFAPEGCPDPFDRIVQSWDTANTIKSTSAFSVCTTWGVKDKHVWLLNVHRGRMIYPDLKRAVLQQAALFEPTEVFIEDHASGTQLLQELRRAGLGIYRPVKPMHDKPTRMINQSALIEAGFVHIPREAPWLAEFLYEFSVFPNGKFFDQIDSTSQALDQIANHTMPYANLYEFYRQEAEATERRANGGSSIERNLGAVQAPPGMSGYGPVEGEMFHPDQNGVFHLPRHAAIRAANLPGWRMI